LPVDEGFVAYPSPSLPTDEEVAAARISGRGLGARIREGDEMQELEILDEKGAPHRLTVPASGLMLIVKALTDLGKGNVVNIASTPPELSADEAAALLGLPLPDLMQLLEDGEIPSRKATPSRRILYRDVIEHKRRMDANAEIALAEMVRLNQDLGLYD